MHFFQTLFSKILFLLILIGIGVILKRKEKISDQSLRDMSRVNMDVFWPALIISSMITGLDRHTLQQNMLLPVFAAVTAFTGMAAGYLLCRMNRWQGHRKNIFMYHSTINNFVFLVLPFITFLLPKNGAGLLFIHNIGFMIIQWTAGVGFLTHSLPVREKIRHMLSPGLIATFIGILTVTLNAGAYVPPLILEILEILGRCTVPVAMIIAGGQIANLGLKALKFDAWNIQLGFVRLLAVPGILAVLTLLLRNFTSVSDELLIVFMTVNLAPASVNAVSMAIYYGSDADLAAEGIVFTHLFSLATMLFFFWIMKDFFMLFI